ncbi:MAG: hypothetical protein AB8F74_02365, partial [Saprospiraceae bacterium]
MSSYNLTKAKNNPRLKKRILKATIRVKLNTGDFSAKRLIENSKFKELSFGNLNLRIDECNVLENINTELIESITELKSEGLIRISKHG